MGKYGLISPGEQGIIQTKECDSMKKIAVWTVVLSMIIFVIAWGVMGVKILDGNYGITAEACTGAVCLAVLLVCAIYIRVTNRCPHCGKMKQTFGKFCPYCGKEIS